MAETKAKSVFGSKIFKIIVALFLVLFFIFAWIWWYEDQLTHVLPFLPSITSDQSVSP